jgi:hypothetical protein
MEKEKLNSGLLEKYYLAYLFPPRKPVKRWIRPHGCELLQQIKLCEKLHLEIPLLRLMYQEGIY